MNNFSSYSHRQHCHCGQVIFFDNNECLRCGAELAFHPIHGRLLSLVPAAIEGRWLLHEETVTSHDYVETYQRCANVESAALCNWLVTGELDQGATGDLCLACSLNITIPDLSQPGNEEYWHQCETAKRRLIAQMLMLGLPVETRQMNPAQGLGFQLLRWQPGEPAVITGHENGIITLDIAEADPAHREQVRQQMQESYRTLLGHFRHESGHYYWDRLVRDTHWLPIYRQFFGDERLDYHHALDQYYQSGPPPKWQNQYISNYASAHPWEDWAETWAHYLHMNDTLSAAAQFGIDADALSIQTDPFPLELLADCPFYPSDADNDPEKFLTMVNRWVRLSSVLNVLARSMGQQDSYPFVLMTDSLRKLYLVHTVVGGS